MKAIDFLRKPYARRLIPDESGGFVASIQEFPGCIAEGDTADEALANLDRAAESWIEASLEAGQTIPEPLELQEYSGKIALRLPRGIHKMAAERASAEGTSLNQLLVAAVANYLGSGQAFDELAKRLQRQCNTVNLTFSWTNAQQRGLYEPPTSIGCTTWSNLRTAIWPYRISQC
jgi:predicted RNase H-like HicB family nuclease